MPDTRSEVLDASFSDFGERAAQVLAGPAQIELFDDGAVVVTHPASTGDLRIAPDARDGATLTLGDRTLVVREDGAIGAPARIRDAATFARADGRSYWTVATEHTAGFEEWLEIEPGHAFADRALARWEVVGHTLREVAGGVHVLDDRGEPLAYVSAPRAFAEGGAPVDARLTVEADRIVLRVDAHGARVLVDPLWVPTGLLNYARGEWLQGFGLVAIPGGAIVFGNQNVLPHSTEVYSIASGTWRIGPSMVGLGRRSGASTTLLADGRILVAGGLYGTSCTAMAEIYDPTTDAFTSAGSMTGARCNHSAVLLASGQVLVAGGSGPSAEIYDPTTNAWSVTAPMPVAMSYHTATRLQNGSVLHVTGTTALLYAPASAAWSYAASLTVLRDEHTATLLTSGRVLVTGGYLTPSAELYDPATNAWSATGSMAIARYQHTATLLPDGRVLVVGGHGDSSPTEIYDPATGAFSPDGALGTYRRAHAAALLETGQVLVAGGYASGGHTQSSELWDGIPVCGNGRVQGSEACDDGNTIDGDCCSSTCQLEPATTVCRASIGACDAEERCTGTSPSCPVDALASATTVCRAAAGACDLEESCTGSDANCPADAVAPATTTCRDAAGACDVAETCTGSDAACPIDAFAPPTTICRAAVSECDSDDTCSGATADCPADAAHAEGSACGPAPSGACDLADACSGTTGAGATCEQRFESAGTECEAPSCTGSMATSAGTCDATGGCAPGAIVDCAPFICGGDVCLTSCTSSADCMAGLVCVAGDCVSPPSDAGAVDAGRDAGVVGDASTSPDAGTTTSSGGGCGCAIVGAPNRGDAGSAIAALFALGWVAHRRRARR